MGNVESTPYWASRAYRKVEPTQAPAEASLLIPFSSKPPIFSAGWFADKISIAFVLGMRSLTPTAFTYLFGWAVSALAGNLKVKAMLRSYIPQFLIDILTIAARKALLLLFVARKYVKKLLLSFRSLFPSLTPAATAPTSALSSPIAAASALAKLRPTAVLPSVLSLQGLLQRSMTGVVDGLRAVLPAALTSFLPSNATIATLASIGKWAFRVWCISEALFYFYFLNRKKHLNNRSIPEDIPPTPAMRRAHIRRLLNHVMASGKCPILFIREWFNGAEFKDIRHQNLREWAAGAFFNKAVEECSREEILEMDDTVKYIQRATGLQAHQGYNSRVTSIRFTMDPIRVLHRPLIFYTSLYASAKLVGDTLLRRLGFVRHQGPFFTYWHRPASNKTANQAARKYAQRHGAKFMAASTSSASEDDSDHDDIVHKLQRKRTHAVHIPREKRVRALKKYYFPKQNVVVEDLEEDDGDQLATALRTAHTPYSAYSKTHQQEYESDSESVFEECAGSNGSNGFDGGDSGNDSDDEGELAKKQQTRRNSHSHASDDSAAEKAKRQRRSSGLSLASLRLDAGERDKASAGVSFASSASQQDTLRRNSSNVSSGSGRSSRRHLPFSARVQQAEADEGAIVFVHGIGVGVWTYYLFISAMVERFPNKDIFLPELDYVSMRLSEYVPSARQGVAGLRLMLLSQGFARAVWAAHSYGTFVVGHCLRFEPSIVEHVIQIDPVCFLIHQMDGPFQFLFAPPSCAQARLIHYIAQTEIGVVHTLSRRLWWYQSIVWEDHIPSGSAVVLSAKDTIVPSASVRHYLQHSSHRIRLLWFENLPHAGFVTNFDAIHQILDCVAPYRPPAGTKPIPRPPRVPCARPCPAADVVFEPGLLSPTNNDLLCPPALTPGPTEMETPSSSYSFLFPEKTASTPLGEVPPSRSCSYMGIDSRGMPYLKQDSSASISPSSSTALKTRALSPAASNAHKRCPACPATCVSACCVQELFNPYTPVRVPIPIDCDDLFGEEQEAVDLQAAHNAMMRASAAQVAAAGDAGASVVGEGKRGDELDGKAGVVCGEGEDSSAVGERVEEHKTSEDTELSRRQFSRNGKDEEIKDGDGVAIHNVVSGTATQAATAGSSAADLRVNRDSYWCSRLQDRDFVHEDGEQDDVDHLAAQTSVGVTDSMGINANSEQSKRQQYMTTVQTYQPVVSQYSTLKHLQKPRSKKHTAHATSHSITASSGRKHRDAAESAADASHGDAEQCEETRCGPPPRPLCVIRLPSPSARKEHDLDTPLASRETSPVR